MKIEDLIITRYGVKKQIEQLIKHRQELDKKINELKEDEEIKKSSIRRESVENGKEASKGNIEAIQEGGQEVQES